MTTLHTTDEWEKIHQLSDNLKKYNEKHVTTINFTEQTLAFLRYIRDSHHGLSVSAIVRELVDFSLPYFLTNFSKMDKIMKNNIKKFHFENPKITLEKIKIAKKIAASKKKKRIELKKKYPNIPDYKGINEE